MNKRDIYLAKYGISRARYRELKGFCEQYQEWKEKVQDHAFISSVTYKTTPGNPNKGTTDMTGNTAVKLSKYQNKIDVIERCAKEADPDYWQELIECICCDASAKIYIETSKLPMSTAVYYNRRRYFFILLDQELK